jgi:hypothetical protein
MTVGSKTFCLVLAIGLALAVVSCGPNREAYGFEEDIRWVDVSTWPYSQSAQEQLTVTAISHVHLKYSDALNHTKWLTKVELDFGDGLGWLDFSPQFLATQTLEANTLSQDVTHTYAQAGSYTIRIRATFWDGGVVTTFMGGGEAVTHVTVPPGS